VQAGCFHVCEQLREPLGKLLGVGGFKALLSRALALASAEIPWLNRVRLNGDGSLEGTTELSAEFSSKQVTAAETQVISELIELLVTFLGGALTSRLLGDIWPEMGKIHLE
jgi:hypothetical protein